MSAALLLYGCYRVSIDAPLFNQELARLWFNFSSVQLYEITLVFVAIFLARRSLWYDSTLLVCLENMFVFVPFILISQAALTGARMTACICAAGVILVGLRFGSLRRYFKELNLPNRLLGVGLALLAINVALPLVYRHYIEFKLGVHLDSGPDYVMNECNWLLVLPAALALANFLPRTSTQGNLLPQRRWLPAGMFSLWFAVTAVHLYSLDYVYGYDLRGELLAPAVWVLAWTILTRIPDRPTFFKPALFVATGFTPLIASAPNAGKTFLSLTALNIIGYAIVRLRHRENRLVGHLAYASALMIVTQMPDFWLQFIGPGIGPGQCFVAGLAVYGIYWTGWSRNPKLAVIASILLAIGVAILFSDYQGAAHWAAQSAFIFLLLHSLRWNDAENRGANFIRRLTALAWVIFSFVWMSSDNGKFWMPFIPGVLVILVYCLSFPCRGIWRLFVVPAAALLVVLSGPSSAAVDELQSAPVGLLAVVGSFLLLGFGTVAALTRELWHKHEL